MIKMTFVQTIICICLFILSCKSYKKDPVLEQILSKAGDNKSEILKVVKHYGNSKRDSLKLKAAYFLIGNMDGMPTLDTNSVQKNEVYFNYLNTINAPVYKVFSIATKGIDSINASIKYRPTTAGVSYQDEITKVTSDFLIRNIDSAFYMWENMPWAKHVSFEDFCEYILPYRCTSTYSDNIRDFFLAKYRILPDSIKSLTNMHDVGKFIINDVNSWFAESADIIPKYPFLNPIKFTNLLKGKIGACIDANSVRVAALRAMGIATAFDQIPNWGNNNLPHFWFRIIDPKNDTAKVKITNANEDRSTQHLISASSFDAPYFEGTPSHIQVNFNRTIPKVYRHCFSKQKSSLAWISGTDEIPPFFQNVRLKDVTSEYLETSDVKLNLAGYTDRKYSYLCVFDNQRWVPIAWSMIKDGKVNFHEMGKNIVYLPAYFENGEVIPAGNPFLLTLEGNIKNIKAAKSTEPVKLFTKYPMRTYVIRWEAHLLGGRFQLANKKDFSDSVTIYRIKNLPFYEKEFKVHNPKPFRYILYQFSGLRNAYASEFKFYGFDKSGKEVKLKGMAIGNPGEYPHLLGKLFDSLTFNLFKADMSRNETYAGLDLGEGNAARISKVVFMPYTDDNAVKNGDTYELFYWDNSWKSLGLSKADGVKYVTFNKVPKGSLLLLENISGGVQQRIFVYSKNKQIFW